MFSIEAEQFRWGHLLADTEVVTQFEWQSYSVQTASKRELLDFLLAGLEERGCRIVHASAPNRAPFYIVFDSPVGERLAVLAYAFFANSKVTAGRPTDEHRFQIKYGSNLKSILRVALDPHQVVTTIFLGIDTEEQIFVAADPLLNNPSPMSRSIEFKKEHVTSIKREGWVAWERDRRPGKSKDRETADIEDLRTEILLGARRERILDLISLERLGRGLDPGERHLLADKLRSAPSSPVGSHSLIQEFGLDPNALLDLINTTSRLKMAVKGWVAEEHLVESLVALPGVSDCRRLVEEGKPDLALRWKGGPEILVECKNSLRTQYADKSPKVDFQRTRASKGNPCSRFYQAADFSVLAACLHAVTEQWEFRFALTRELPAHETCAGRIASNVRISAPTFTHIAEYAFQRHYDSLSR